jgi:serine/threonine protein kinase
MPLAVDPTSSDALEGDTASAGLTLSERKTNESLEQLCQRILEYQCATVCSRHFRVVEDILKQFPELREEPNKLTDIVYNEYLQRAEASRNADIEQLDYLRRFPEIANELQDQFQLRDCLESDCCSAFDVSDEPPIGVETFGGRSSTEARRDTTPVPDISGCVIDDHFQILERIGEGGMATVYRARDRQLQRDVALKISRSACDSESHQYQRFIREAESVARLSHPGIVQVFEAGQYLGRPFIVGQLVVGGSLATRIDNRTISDGMAATWLTRICDAVEYAHQCGVVHRDLKPANILLENDDRPLITDFGLASLTEADSTLTRQGDVIGTPAYMSPEQATGDGDVTPVSDVYSLGVILYKLICGQLPFSGPAAAVLHQAIHSDPVEPRRHRPSISKDLQTICLKSIEKRPSDRYRTARAMAEDLRRFLNDEPVFARPTSSAERLARLVRRHPAVSGIVMLLIAICGFTLGGAVQYNNVVDQRNRATDAESQTRKLLADEAALSGELALQRGQTRVAAEQFAKALRLGHDGAAALHLRIVECEIINGRFHLATNQLASAIAIHDELATRDRVLLLKVQLALPTETENGTAAEMLNAIRGDGLSESDQAYLSGLRATNTQDALGHFQRSLQHDPYHHGSRRLAVLCGLSLAHFDDVVELAAISRQLFPDDQDFLLAEALALAGKGQIAKAVSHIDTTEFSSPKKQSWRRFATFLNHLCHDFNSGAERVFHRGGLQDGEFTLDSMTAVFDQFTQEYLPLVRGRGWYLPPQVESAFAGFQQVAAEAAATRAAGENRALQSDGSVEEPASTSVVQHPPLERRLADAGIRIVEAHPEATLSTVIARFLLDSSSPDLLEKKKIQFFYENALHADSFISDVRPNALIGAFAVAVNLNRVEHHESESNRARAIELLQEINPDDVVDAETLRVMTLLPIHWNRWDIAGEWAPRWVRAAREQKEGVDLLDALWHNALVLQQEEDWFNLITACNEILDEFPEPSSWPPPVRPDYLKRYAVGRLNAALGADRESIQQ